MTATTLANRTVPAATLAVAGAAWIAALQHMRGMDLGVATDLGSFWFFLGAWVSMMAAMMLPGAVPAIVRHVRADGRVLAALRFAGSYLAVWTLVGLGVYLTYKPHSAAAAGAITIAAAGYELTPLKRECRRLCRAGLRSGLRFGLYCVGSSIGLMAMLGALGLMSVTWMVVVAILVSAQKLVPPQACVDVALALALLALGIFVAV
jgi:predicted metal-binding membrane protein